MASLKNPYLAEILACPECASDLHFAETKLTCQKCAFSVPIKAGIPLFTQTPETLQPWQRVERGPQQGTPWRQANWRWLEGLVRSAPEDALYLDIGCGHGDFQQIFEGRRTIGLDIVPYPEVDIACDLTQCVPFKTGSVERVVMMNVLEHVYAAENLLTRLATLLKSDAEIWMAVPFMLKIHQEPYDFARYTPYALQNIAAHAGLRIERMHGFYEPVFQLKDALGTVWAHALPPRRNLRSIFARAAIFIIQLFSSLLGRLLPKGELADPLTAKNPAAMGFMLILKKA